MFKNKNEEEEEEEDPNASYNRKFYGDANKYDEDYYNNYIKQYQAAQNMRFHKTNMNSNLFVLNSFVRPGSGPSGAEVEEVETCMEEVTEDTTSSVSVEEEVEEEEEIDTEGNVDTCIGCRAEEVEKEVLEEKEITSSPAEVETEGKRTAPPAPPTSATKPARMKMKMHPAAAAAARAAMGSPARQLSAAPATSATPPAPSATPSAPCSDPASPPRTQCSAPSSPLTPPETAAPQEAEKERPVEKPANTTTTTNFWGMSKEEEIDPSP